MLPFKLLDKDSDSGLIVLALGAHADDIELGCGGTLLMLREILREKLKLIYVLFTKEDNLPEVQEQSRRAVEKLGAEETLIYDFPDTRLPNCWSEIKDQMLSIRNRYHDIDCVFSHFRRDQHQDHQTVAQNTWRIFRDHLILEYEIFKYEGDLRTPNLYVPLSEEIAARKVELLHECFPSRHQGACAHDWFTRENLLSLMRVRGMESNTRFAEGFHVRKAICSFI